MIREPSLLELFETHYAPRRLKSATDSCKAQYRRNIGYLSKWLTRPALPSDLTDDNVELFLISLEEGRSPATVNKIRAQIVALWRFLWRKGFVSTGPDVPKVKEFRRAPVAWMQDQLEKLLASCAEHPGEWFDVKASDWWTALHLVLWDTGARLGAVLQLEWSRVDLDSGVIILIAETQKQDADQVFRLHPSTVEMLRKLMIPEQQLVFYWPYARASLWNHYHRILQRAGLPCDRRRKFHCIRRSHASHLKAAGMNPSIALGHSTEALTRVYLDPRISEKVAPIDVLFRPS